MCWSLYLCASRCANVLAGVLLCCRSISVLASVLVSVLTRVDVEVYCALCVYVCMRAFIRHLTCSLCWFVNTRPVILYSCSGSRCSKSCKRKTDELSLTYQQPTARQTSSLRGKWQIGFILSFKSNTRNLFQKYQLVVFCNTQAWVVRSQARGRAEITFDTWHILQLMLSLRVRALYIAFRLTSSLYTFKTKFFKPLLIFSLHLCCINQNIFSTNSGTSGVASRGHNPWLRAGWDGTSGDNP